MVIEEKLLKVADIMTRHLYVLNRTDSLPKAKSMFEKYNIRHLPVSSGGELIGMLSLTDIKSLPANEKEDSLFKLLTVELIMSENPMSISNNEEILDVAKILSEREFHALPVVDGGKLVGIVTTTDIIRYLLNEVKIR